MRFAVAAEVTDASANQIGVVSNHARRPRAGSKPGKRGFACLIRAQHRVQQLAIE
nr:hypothetical protein [Paraburkholderia sp. J76]